MPLHYLGGGQLSWGPVGTALALPALAGQVAPGERGAWPPPYKVRSLVSDVLSWPWNLAGRSEDDTCVRGCMSVYGGLLGEATSTVLSEVQVLHSGFYPTGATGPTRLP